MTRSQAIARKCLECSGGSFKEVTLCHLIDCPLYPYRLGCGPKSKKYKKRMETAFKRFPEDLKEIRNIDENLPFLMLEPQLRMSVAKKK